MKSIYNSFHDRVAHERLIITTFSISQLQLTKPLLASKLGNITEWVKSVASDVGQVVNVSSESRWLGSEINESLQMMNSRCLLNNHFNNARIFRIFNIVFLLMKYLNSLLFIWKWSFFFCFFLTIMTMNFISFNVAFSRSIWILLIVRNNIAILKIKC